MNGDRGALHSTPVGGTGQRPSTPPRGVDRTTGEILDAMSDLESRIGIPSLAELLPARAKLVREIAPLRAKYGSFGTAEAWRKIELAKVRAIIRAQTTGASKRMSADAIDDAAHSSTAYVDLIITQTNERARWIELEERLEAITMTVNRGQALSRFASAETFLTPRTG